MRGGWDGYGIAHFILTFIFIAAIVGLAIWLVTFVRRTHHEHPQMAAAPPAGQLRPDPAVDEARLRYARGEITRDQFTQIAGDLGDPNAVLTAAQTQGAASSAGSEQQSAPEPSE